MAMTTQVGVGAEFKFEGQTLVVAPISAKVRALYERWLQYQPFAFIDNQRQKINQFAIERLERLAIQDLSSHIYDWDGIVCKESLMSVAGIKQMFLIRLQINHPHIEESIIEKIFDEWGWKRPYELMAIADGKTLDPKPESPSTEEAKGESLASPKSVENS